MVVVMLTECTTERKTIFDPYQVDEKTYKMAMDIYESEFLLKNVYFES